MELEFNPDSLRPVKYLCEPDPRHTLFAKVDLTNGFSRPIELADLYEDISECGLHAGVPQDIAQQFETTKNLYLHSWFVYRFYPVAEQHSLSCLELALRERLKVEISKGNLNERRPGLHCLLSYAVEHGLVKNEGFATWRNRGEINSRHRVEEKMIREAFEKNLDTTRWEEPDVEITAEDLNWDYAKMLAEALPKLRNEYAHGSTDLHNLALGTIHIVCEIINQLFGRPQAAEVGP
jgi:hypothetical protein